MRFTASICPISTLYPRIYVKMILATYLIHVKLRQMDNNSNQNDYFFFWYPSKLPSKYDHISTFFVCKAKKSRHQTFEFLPNVGHLLIDSFLFEFLDPSTADVRDELGDDKCNHVIMSIVCRTWVKPRILVAMLMNKELKTKPKKVYSFEIGV